ncbi:MAG: type III polyketide synthase [Chitinophagales bacterium]|nr:type III polyketide synthase [Chitinophagales bacterium]
MKKKRASGSLLLSIGTAVPEYRYQQQAIADFMVRYFRMPEDTGRKLSIIYKKSGIDYRHSVLPDFFNNGHDPLLFDATSIIPSLSKRMGIYQAAAADMAVEAAKDCLANISRKAGKRILPITHLISVSCTGMSAPGLDLQVMQQLQLDDNVARTSVNFMGCYAAFHAMKMADAICRADNEATVLIVMVELCSLHFQPELDSQNLVVNSLFADGAAAMVISSGKKCRKTEHPAFAINGFYSKVLHEGKAMMTWHPSEKGFLMGLDSLVPQLIEDHAGPMMEEALESFNSKRSKITHWAIHPGGRKILEAVKRGMRLTDDNLMESYEVLRNFGNMSSPTIAFVLKRMMQDHASWKKKVRILSAGFGPGITIETALLKPVIASS